MGLVTEKTQVVLMQLVGWLINYYQLPNPKKFTLLFTNSVINVHSKLKYKSEFAPIYIINDM